MKRLMTGIAISTLALAVAGANADYIWDGGGGDTSWQTQGNWDPDAAGPTSGDVDIKAVNLAVGSPQTTADWDYTGFPAYTYTSIEVVSDSGDKMTLQKSGTKGLNAGTLTLQGDGGSNYTTLDVDQNMSASSTTVTKNVDIEVAPDKTFSAGDLTIGDGTNAVTLTKYEAGSVTCDSIVIYEGTATVSVGSITTQ